MLIPLQFFIRILAKLLTSAHNKKWKKMTKQKKLNLNSYKRYILKWDTFFREKKNKNKIEKKRTDRWSTRWSDYHWRIKNYHVCLHNALSPDSKIQWGHKILECLFRILSRPCSWLIVAISAKKKIEFGLQSFFRMVEHDRPWKLDDSRDYLGFTVLSVQ